MTDPVAAALRHLPSHGWTQGMFGRRDRCLLVLSQLAGVPYRHLATLTTSAVEITDGTAIITSPAGTWSIRPADDSPLLCGSCAITRWLRVLDVVMTNPSSGCWPSRSPMPTRSPTSRRTCADPPGRSPRSPWAFRCCRRSTNGVTSRFSVERLTPHSLSRRVRDILAGDLGAHRHLPVDPDEDAESEQPGLVPVVERGVYSRDDAQRAWARRRADLEDLAGIDDVLAEIDARAKELERRTATVLAQNTLSPTKGNQ